MAQKKPSYPMATGNCEKPIVDKLYQKYGKSNVSWPIVLIKDEHTVAYLYEKNKKNTINLEMNSRPGSKSHLLSYYLNYTSSPRYYLPNDINLSALIKEEYTCSYDYILRSNNYYTVDLDYVWYTGTKFKGFELTTFWVEFSSLDIALSVISKMNRRKSWQGKNGAKAFHKIVDSAQDLGVDYYLVCANTVDEVGSMLKTDGNVCVIKMTHDNVVLLENGNKPNDVTFMSFAEFLEWL